MYTWMWLFIGSVMESISLCSLLWMLSPDYFNHKRKQILVVLAAAACSVLTDAYPALLGYFLNYGVFIGALAIASKRRVMDVAAEFCIVITIYGLSQYAAMFFLEVVHLQLPQSPEAGMLQILAPLLVISVLLGINGRARLFCSAGYAKYRKELCVIGVNSFFLYFLEQYLWQETYEIWVNGRTIVAGAFLLMAVLNIILMKSLMENRENKDLLRMHDQHMDQTNRFFTELLSQKHEFNRHLQVISGYTQTRGGEEAVKLIQQYLEDVKKKDEETRENFPVLLTGIDDLNALIFDEQRRWEVSGIRIFCIADHSSALPLQRYEFVEIVGNLIRNACEAAAELPVHMRDVRVEIGSCDEGTFICVKNKTVCAPEAPSHFFRKGYSTKDGAGRGYGLYNVKRIAKRRGGKLEAVLEDDCLCTRVLFQ